MLSAQPRNEAKDRELAACELEVFLEKGLGQRTSSQITASSVGTGTGTGTWVSSRKQSEGNAPEPQPCDANTEAGAPDCSSDPTSTCHGSTMPRTAHGLCWGSCMQQAEKRGPCNKREGVNEARQRFVSRLGMDETQHKDIRVFQVQQALNGQICTNHQQEARLKGGPIPIKQC